MKNNTFKGAPEELEPQMLNEEELGEAAGGVGVFKGLRIITQLSRPCPLFEKGPNFYNRRCRAIPGTCGECAHLIELEGWFLCDIQGNV